MADWMPIKTCPANTVVEFAFWEVYDEKRSFKIRCGTVYKRFLGFLWKIPVKVGYEPMYWRHLPPIPKDQENVG